MLTQYKSMQEDWNTYYKAFSKRPCYSSLVSVFPLGQLFITLVTLYRVVELWRSLTKSRLPENTPFLRAYVMSEHL
jgi:nucleoside diphosphate kinase